MSPSRRPPARNISAVPTGPDQNGSVPINESISREPLDHTVPATEPATGPVVTMAECETGAVDVLEALLERDESYPPWGFQLRGGVDCSQPLAIARVGRLI